MIHKDMIMTALTGLNLKEGNTDIEFIAQWSPVVKKNRSPDNKILLSHHYYQPLSTAIARLREISDTKTKILGRIKNWSLLLIFQKELPQKLLSFIWMTMICAAQSQPVWIKKIMTNPLKLTVTETIWK